MQGEAERTDRDARRQRITEAQAVGESAEGVEADVGHHLVAAGFHNHRDRAVSVHLRSALLVGSLVFSTNAVSLARRAFSRMRAGQLRWLRE